MMNPKVTVLMSVYNGERFLREAIESVLNQTYGDFEFLILNDGSTDSSRDIILSYADPRIRLIDNEKNIGLTRSLNKGLRLAKGQYIARMDADDISLPQRLEAQTKYLEKNPGVVLLGTWVEIIDGDGKVRDVWRYPTNHCLIAWRLLFGNCFAHASVMYRKDETLKLGGYNNSLTYTQDYELWIRLSKLAQIRQLPEVLVRCRKFITESVGKRHLEKQLETAQQVAFDYAKSILNKIDYDNFAHFFNKTKNDDLEYQQVKAIVILTKNIKDNFFEINHLDDSCKKRINQDIQGWFIKWAMNNRGKPLLFLYLIISGTLVKTKTG